MSTPLFIDILGREDERTNFIWIAGPLAAPSVVCVTAFCVLYAVMRRKKRIKLRTVSTEGGIGTDDDEGLYMQPIRRVKVDAPPHKTDKDVCLLEIKTNAFDKFVDDQASGCGLPSLTATADYHNLGPNLAFPRHRVLIEKELGRGAFGRVLLGTALGIDKSGPQTKVAVKTIKEGADGSARSELLQELDLMKKIGSHPNVVKLLGYCTNADPVYVIVEYLANGDLKTVLKKCKADNTGSTYSNIPGLSSTLSQTFLKFAKDVANGMAFLSSQNCIHRDLAARNVLVSEDMVCKVADFGLARDVMNVRMYQRQSQGPLPMRWMALESLFDDVYTTQSDVWSFGVLLWEIFTFGARPYPLLSIQTMLNMLKRGYRMPRPKCCKQPLYSIMCNCWHGNPEERPGFRALYEQLERLSTDEMDYINIDQLDEVVYDDTVIREEKL